MHDLRLSSQQADTSQYKQLGGKELIHMQTLGFWRQIASQIYDNSNYQILSSDEQKLEGKVMIIFIPGIQMYVLCAQKNASHLDVSFEYPQHIFRLRNW